MLRTAVRLTPTFIPLFQHKNENDYDMLNTKISQDPETGFERVKRMFSKNEFDQVSVELHNIVQSASCGTFIGACMGGFFKSREAYMYFIENNQATIFKSTMEAKKRLQDYVTVAFAKGAYQWGWRLGIFTGIFSLVATTMSVYRGNTSLIEYITAGMVTGAMYKANLGPVAMLVGAGLGAVLSTVGGLAILGILNITGVSMEDIRQALHKIKEAREDQYKQAEDRASDIKNDSLAIHHDIVVEVKGEKHIEDI